jgi:tetratricopeptide (TPR) repeat protein
LKGLEEDILKSQKLFEKSVEIWKLMGSYTLLAQQKLVMQYTAEAFRLLGQLHKARHHFEEALRLYDKIQSGNIRVSEECRQGLKK